MTAAPQPAPTPLWLPPGMTPKSRYTVTETATILREHPQTTYRRLRNGQLRGTQYVRGGTWFIRAEDLAEFLAPSRPA